MPSHPLKSSTDGQPTPSSVTRRLVWSSRADQRDLDVGGVAVPDGVGHRFLRDAEEVRRHAHVVEEERIVAIEAAGDSEEVLDFAGEVLQRRHQPVSGELHRQQSMRQLARHPDRLIDELCEARGFVRFGAHRPRPQLLFEHLAEECDAGEVLAEPVVQVLADAPLLALAGVENRAFELLAIGDVDAGRDDVGDASGWRRAARRATR